MAYYRRIADAVELSILLYDIPKFTHVNLEPNRCVQSCNLCRGGQLEETWKLNLSPIELN